MAQMITDLLQNIYGRIAQLGQEIQNLRVSLDALNQNIEVKIGSLTSKMQDFSKEIEVTKISHISSLKEMGGGVVQELMKVQEGLGLKDIDALINNLNKFTKLSEEVLSQETVNLLLSEAINSVKSLKESVQK